MTDMRRSSFSRLPGGRPQGKAALGAPRQAPVQSLPGGFNAYAAGNKHYGAGGDAATVGPVDKSGYIARDTRKAAQRNALLASITDQLGGRFANPNWLRKAR